MKKVIILIMLMIGLSYNILALDCKYISESNYTVDSYHGYNKKTLEILNDPIIENIKGYSPSPFHGYYPIEYEIIQNNDVPLDVVVKYKVGERRYQQELSLEPLQRQIISQEWEGPSGPATIDVNSIEYEYKDTPYVFGNWVKEQKTEVFCKVCNDKICLNDGSSCQKSSECGGTFCIRGFCSNSLRCFSDDCKCASDEVQCKDNKRCSKKNTILIDVKPECNNPQECVTGYIQLETGLCSKSPSQIKEEENQRLKFLIYAIVSIALIIAISFGFVWHLKNKNEEEKQKTEYAKQKTIQKQMDFVVTKLHTKSLELEKIKHEIHELKINKRIKEAEVRKLKGLKDKEFSLLNEIDGIEQQIDAKWENLKPFPDPQAKNRLVILNPYLGGYKCFYNKELELKEYPISSLVHRWVWKHKTGNWPRQGYHIHHVDGDKYNNNPDNLEEIDGDKHYNLHRR